MSWSYIPALAWPWRVPVPDFITGVQLIRPKRSTLSFKWNGFVEVKAIQSDISLSTSRYQIQAEIDQASAASASEVDFQSAGEHKAGALTLVIPFSPNGSGIEQEVIDYATKMGVNLYVSYVFRKSSTGAIVFSTPNRLNNLGVILTPYGPIGNIDGIKLDFKKATDRWRVQEKADEDGLDDK
jgi:hypothetical protein